MSTALATIENAQVPAFLKSAMTSSVTTALAALSGSGFPFLSIKGKVFTLLRNKEETVLYKPLKEGETEEDLTPANSIEVVIVSAAPRFSKVYYLSGYTEGAKDKPSCSSNDGITPDAGVPAQQAKKCAACKHNAWGTGKGGKGKACSDSLRLAVSPAGQINDPMLLRVPPASLKHVTEYASALEKRGLPIEGCITRIRFDPAEATPLLLFTFRGTVSEAQYKEVKEVQLMDVTKSIIGAGYVPVEEDSAAAETAEAAPADRILSKDDDDDEVAAPPPPPKAAKAPRTVPPPVQEDTKAKASGLAAKLAASLGDDLDD